MVMGGSEWHEHMGRHRRPGQGPGEGVAVAMPGERRRYLAYLVRFWDASTTGTSLWHASVEDPQTGQRRGFATLESLCAFFAEQLTGRGDDHTLSGSRQHPPAVMEGGDPPERPGKTDDHGTEGH